MLDAREKNRLRAAEYRKKNPEKVRETNRRSAAKKRQDPQKIEATRAYQAEYRAKNRSALCDRERKRKFGITRNEYANMFHSQNGVCAICSEPETATRLGVIKALSVDHDHKTGKVRGLLCSDCNTGIGKLKENRNVFISAIKYLDQHSDKEKVVTDFVNLLKEVKNVRY
jgi:hypothetical protein